jgi:hypothetical protein
MLGVIVCPVVDGHAFVANQANAGLTFYFLHHVLRDGHDCTAVAAPAFPEHIGVVAILAESFDQVLPAGTDDDASDYNNSCLHRLLQYCQVIPVFHGALEVARGVSNAEKAGLGDMQPLGRCIARNSSPLCGLRNFTFVDLLFTPDDSASMFE